MTTPTTTSPLSLSAILEALLHRAQASPITLNGLLAFTSDRGVALMMVVATAPFLIPISIPGVSTPFGAVLALCGLFTARARPVLLPRRLGERELPQAALVRALRLLRRVFGRLERLLRPRVERLATNPRLLRLHGAYVFLMALILAIPFPTVPFIGSNAIAAWPIFLLGLGLLERDGWFVGLAYAWIAVFVLYWIFFYAALVEFWQAVWPRLAGFFGAG